VATISGTGGVRRSGWREALAAAARAGAMAAAGRVGGSLAAAGHASGWRCGSEERDRAAT
jgi:hypothetical protein